MFRIYVKKRKIGRKRSYNKKMSHSLKIMSNNKSVTSTFNVDALSRMNFFGFSTQGMMPRYPVFYIVTGVCY